MSRDWRAVHGVRNSPRTSHFTEFRRRFISVDELDQPGIEGGAGVGAVISEAGRRFHRTRSRQSLLLLACHVPAQSFASRSTE